MTNRHIPVVDLEPFRAGGPEERDAVAAALDTADREVGFASVVGHGGDPDLIACLQV